MPRVHSCTHATGRMTVLHVQQAACACACRPRTRKLPSTRTGRNRTQTTALACASCAAVGLSSLPRRCSTHESRQPVSWRLCMRSCMERMVSHARGKCMFQARCRCMSAQNARLDGLPHTRIIISYQWSRSGWKTCHLLYAKQCLLPHSTEDLLVAAGLHIS